MEVSGQLHVPSASLPEKEPLVNETNTSRWKETQGGRVPTVPLNVEVNLHAFYTSELDGDVRWVSRSGHFTPEEILL
jgi:hypothetical protein